MWPSPASRGNPADSERIGATFLSGLSLSGAEVRVDLGSPNPMAVLFLTSSCHGCMPVWSALRSISGPRNRCGLRSRFGLRNRSGPSQRRRLVAIVPDPATENAGVLRSLTPDWLDVVMSSSAWLEMCPGPAPWLIAADGLRITYSGPAPSSPRKLRRLLRS